MGTHPNLFENILIDNNLQPEADSIVFSSDPKVVSSKFIVPRKLKEMVPENNV